MPAPPASPTALRVSALSQSTPTPFSLRPAAQELAALAQALELDGLRKLAFEGDLRPMGHADWELRGQLGATVTQACVITLEPVVTRIDTPVHRIYLCDYTEIDAPEAEMPENDTTEPLGAWIDPAAVMHEALALALPEYPRKEGAGIDTLRVTEPGKTPMTDAQARPFAGLAALKAQLGDDDTT